MNPPGQESADTLKAVYCRRFACRPEKFEVSVLQVYMPQALSEAEIEAVVTEAMTRLGVAGPKDMGRLMADLKPKLAGKADMTVVSALVKGKLAGN